MHVPHLKTEINLERGGKYSPGQVFSKSQLRRRRQYQRKIERLNQKLKKNYQDFNWWTKNLDHQSHAYQAARDRFFRRHLQFARHLAKLGLSFPRDPFDWVEQQRSAIQDRRAEHSMRKAQAELNGQGEQPSRDRELISNMIRQSFAGEHPRWEEGWDYHCSGE